MDKAKSVRMICSVYSLVCRPYQCFLPEYRAMTVHIHNIIGFLEHGLGE